MHGLGEKTRETVPEALCTTEAVRRPACLELLFPATAPVEPELPPMKPRRSNSIAPHRGTSHGSGGSLRRRLEEQRAYAAPAPFPLSFSVVSAPLCVIAAALRYIVCRKKVALPCYLFAANTARQPPRIARAPAGPASRTEETFCDSRVEGAFAETPVRRASGCCCARVWYCAQTMASVLNRTLTRVARPVVRQSNRRMAGAVESTAPEAALQPKKTYSAGDKKLMDAKYTEDIGYMFGEKVRAPPPLAPPTLA